MKIDQILRTLRSRNRRVRKPWSFKSRIIDFMINLLLHRKALLRTKKAYDSYLNGHPGIADLDELVIGSNFMSRGKQREKLVKLAKFEYDPTLYENLSSVLPTFDTSKYADELRMFGFTRLPIKVPAYISSELIKLARTSEVTPTKFATNTNPQKHPDPSIDHIWDVPFQETIKLEATRKLLQDGQLLSVAAQYLSSNPVVIGSRLYWSLAHENEEFQTAENWHVDAGDGLRFVKLFITLTDVDSTTGPTNYILGTHKSLPRKFYSGRRFHKNEIEKRFGERIVEATGELGTIYLADTRGLHRGMPVKRGERLLLHFFYGTDFFGFPRPTTSGLPRDCSFGDSYSKPLDRTFAAFRSDSPSDTSKIPGP
jgi:hypothetical protein